MLKSIRRYYLGIIHSIQLVHRVRGDLNIDSLGAWFLVGGDIYVLAEGDKDFAAFGLDLFELLEGEIRVAEGVVVDEDVVGVDALLLHGDEAVLLLFVVELHAALESVVLLVLDYLDVLLLLRRLHAVRDLRDIGRGDHLRRLGLLARRELELIEACLQKYTWRN